MTTQPPPLPPEPHEDHDAARSGPAGWAEGALPPVGTTPRDPEPPPPHTSGRGTGRVVVAALVALVVGIGAGLLLHGPLFGGSGEDNADLAVTCDYVEELPETVSVEDIRPQEALIWQLQALSGLAVAAHYNGADEAFSDHGMALLSGLQRFEEAGINEGLEGLRGACAAR